MGIEGCQLRLAACVVAAFILLTIGAVLDARALTDAVDVMVLVDRANVDYGESVNVTAYIFNRAVLTDPSSVAAFVDRLPGVSPLNLTRQSVGVFTGVFVFQSFPSEVTVNATVDGTQDSGHAYVFHRPPPRIRIVPSPGVARPGETVSIEVDVAGSSGPQDADSLSLTAQILTSPDFASGMSPTGLRTTHLATGTYLASYPVPGGIDRDSIVYLVAEVTVGSVLFGLGAAVYVPVPNSLLVWYRTERFGPSNETLFVYVGSTAGVPLANARVSFRTVSGPYRSQIFNGTTNSSGSARFDFPLNGSAYGFVGTASYGSLSQPFQGVFPTLARPTVPAWNVVWLNPDEVFAPGETANLRYRLEENGSGVPQHDVFVYAHTGSAFVLAETVSTDTAGEFAVLFVAPAETVRLDLASFVGGAWRSVEETFLANGHLIASVSSVDGRDLSIIGSFPSLTGPWTAALSLSSVWDPNTAAGPVAPAGNFDVAAIVGGLADGTFRFDVELPLFLPPGLPIVLTVRAMSLRTDPASNAFYVFTQTVIVGTPIAERPNLGPWILLSGLAFLVAVLVFVRYRRPPRKS